MISENIGLAEWMNDESKVSNVEKQTGDRPIQLIICCLCNQLHNYPNVALFFLEKDMHQGARMNLHFTKSTIPIPFLPKNIANSIPFSSIKLPERLSKFSVKQNTLESETIKDTISECEAPGIKGQEKYCATSLEKMLDFTTTGKKIEGTVYRC